MSQNNTGLSWVTDVDTYFLRDDQAMGLCDYERYSLFRHWPGYRRVTVFNGPIDWAIHCSHRWVANDKKACDRPGEAVFVDEQL